MDQSQKIEGKVFLANDSLSLHTLVIAVKNQHMSPRSFFVRTTIELRCAIESVAQ